VTGVISRVRGLITIIQGDLTSLQKENIPLVMRRPPDGKKRLFLSGAELSFIDQEKTGLYARRKKKADL